MEELDENSDSKKKVVTWTRNLTLKLIKHYEAHTHLWDVSSKEYKSRKLRKSSMEQISHAMGIPVRTLNDKIHNLRCQLNTIVRKQLRTKIGEGAEENSTVKWEYYDPLKFIIEPTKLIHNATVIDPLSNEKNEFAEIEDSYVQYLQSGSQAECKTKDYSPSSPVIVIETISPSFKAETPYPQMKDETSSALKDEKLCSLINVESPSSSIKVERPSLRTINKNLLQKHRNRKRRKEQEAQEQEASLSNYLGLMLKPSDSFKIFGDYITDELRNMSSKAPDLESRARRQIQRIILEMNDSYDNRISEMSQS